MLELARKYLRTSKMPHIWCPGCGHGIVLGALLRAVDSLGLDKDQVAVVSGIGCAARATGYLDFNTLHALHGRALPFATGLKLANPRLTVIVLTGDGDCAAIGGNHFIHACRRNLDVTVLCFNNNIYGMTNGQYSPMTPAGSYAATAPYGHIEPSFDLCELAESAGASYVARGTAYNTRQLIKLIADGIEHKGFSFVEAISQCPTYFGRKNGMSTALEMLEWQKKNAVNVSAAVRMADHELTGKFIVGLLHRNEAPEYCEEYAKVRLRAGGLSNVSD